MDLTEHPFYRWYIGGIERRDRALALFLDPVSRKSANEVINDNQKKNLTSHLTVILSASIEFVTAWLSRLAVEAEVPLLASALFNYSEQSHSFVSCPQSKKRRRNDSKSSSEISPITIKRKSYISKDSSVKTAGNVTSSTQVSPPCDPYQQ